MKVYIAGAITDNPNYEEQFKAAEERLKARGYEVFNPAKNQGYTYKEYIDMGLFELMHCDAIYLLKGYENSTGATLEHDYARTVGLNIMLEENDLQNTPLIDSRIIPKKPIKGRYGVIVCPNCDTPVGRMVSRDICEEKHNYCSYCGQAINWEV